MAAGQGFKTFVTGEVLTAGDVNGYLMQGINVFASTAARDAAITVPAEGQFAFTKDTNSLWYYDGAAWVASGATGDIEGVTAGIGISGGGTSGTVTVTNSMATAIDAKGDLVPGTGADTFARLAVGANDTVLTADSAAATGMKWATVASGATFSGAVVTQTSAQTIANGTSTTINFNNEILDVGGYHDNSTNNSRLTIPSGKTGYVLVYGKVNMTANATGASEAFIMKNGGAISGNTYKNTATFYASPQVTIISACVPGDYFEIGMYQDSGGNLNTISGQTFTTLMITFLGA